MNETSFLNLKKKFFMNTNIKILDLVNHGFSGTLISELNENQINSLHKRLTESKKESKEETQIVTTQLDSKNPQDMAKLNGMLKNPTSLQNKNVQVKETEMTEGDDTPFEKDMEQDYTGQEGPHDASDEAPDGMDDDSDNNRSMVGQTESEIKEKFESKAQQKLFWAKCGEGKTKEQKKWCKLAREFSDSTSKKQFKKMPEKIHPEKTVKVEKKENKESYLDMVGKAMNKNMSNKISDIKPSLKFESRLQSKIENLVERHVSPKISKRDLLETIKNMSINEAGKEVETPVKPGVDTPSKPKPGTPYQPKHQPAPKAGKEVETPVKPGVDTPSKPKPGTPYQPKHQPAPKAKNGKIPTWLSFKSIGINLK